MSKTKEAKGGSDTLSGFADEIDDMVSRLTQIGYSPMISALALGLSIDQVAQTLDNLARAMRSADDEKAAPAPASTKSGAHFLSKQIEKKSTIGDIVQLLTGIGMVGLGAFFAHGIYAITRDSIADWIRERRDERESRLEELRAEQEQIQRQLRGLDQAEDMARDLPIAPDADSIYPEQMSDSTPVSRKSGAHNLYR